MMHAFVTCLSLSLMRNSLQSSHVHHVLHSQGRRLQKEQPEALERMVAVDPRLCGDFCAGVETHASLILV